METFGQHLALVSLDQQPNSLSVKTHQHCPSTFAWDFRIQGELGRHIQGNWGLRDGSEAMFDFHWCLRSITGAPNHSQPTGKVTLDSGIWAKYGDSVVPYARCNKVMIFDMPKGMKSLRNYIRKTLYLSRMVDGLISKLAYLYLFVLQNWPQGLEEQELHWGAVNF